MKLRTLRAKAIRAIGKPDKSVATRAVQAINRARFCEICGAIHLPPIHDTATCYPGKHGGRIYFSSVHDPDHWPTRDEIQAELRYWDAVFTDKGDKPLS